MVSNQGRTEFDNVWEYVDSGGLHDTVLTALVRKTKYIDSGGLLDTILVALVRKTKYIDSGGLHDTVLTALVSKAELKRDNLIQCMSLSSHQN